MTAGADLVMTANLADFPPGAIPAGISVLAPDDFIVRLIHIDIDAVATVVDQQAGACCEIRR